MNKDISIFPIVVPNEFSVKSFNFYLVKAEEELILVDAGINSEDCWQALIQTLKENGFQLKDINKIILTHSHEDHTGLVNCIIAQHCIPVYAHENSIKRLTRDPAYLKQRVSFFNRLYAEMGCGNMGKAQVRRLNTKKGENDSKSLNAKIIPLKEGDILNGFKVVETFGHCPDHICLFDFETGVFFSGDHLVAHISSNAIIEPDEMGERLPTLQQFEKSLEKCAKLPLKTIHTGHGKMVDEPTQLINKRLKGIERKSEKIKHIIRDLQPCTAAQIAQTFYQDKYESEFPLVMSEIIGHLDRLEAKSKIRKRKRNVVWMYDVHN